MILEGKLSPATLSELQVLEKRFSRKTVLWRGILHEAEKRYKEALEIYRSILQDSRGAWQAWLRISFLAQKAPELVPKGEAVWAERTAARLCGFASVELFREAYSP